MIEQEGTITRSRTWVQLPDDLVADASVSAQAVRLWARLDRYAGRNGAPMPSRSTLAADLGVSEATVKRAYTDLVTSGWASRRRIGASNVWETSLNDQKVVTGDPCPDDEGDGNGSRVTTFETESGHGRPGNGSRVTRPRKERERKGREDSVPRADARVTGDPEELPLDLDEPPVTCTTEQAVQILVGAFVEAWEGSGGLCPTRKRQAIGKNVRDLITRDGYPLPVVLVAVQRAGSARHLDVDRHLGEQLAGYRSNDTKRRAMFDHWAELARQDEARRAAS